MRNKNATGIPTKIMMRDAIKTTQTKDAEYYRLRYRASTDKIIKIVKSRKELNEQILSDIAEQNEWRLDELMSLLRRVVASTRHTANLTTIACSQNNRFNDGSVLS